MIRADGLVAVASTRLCGEDGSTVQNCNSTQSGDHGNGWGSINSAQFGGATQINRPGPRTKDSALPDGNGTYMGMVRDPEGEDN